MKIRERISRPDTTKKRSLIKNDLPPLHCVPSGRKYKPVVRGSETTENYMPPYANSQCVAIVFQLHRNCFKSCCHVFSLGWEKKASDCGFVLLYRQIDSQIDRIIIVILPS